MAKDTLTEIFDVLGSDVIPGIENVKIQTENSVDALIQQLVRTTDEIKETNSILRANAAATNTLLSKLIEANGGSSSDTNLADVAKYIGPIIEAFG